MNEDNGIRYRQARLVYDGIKDLGYLAQNRKRAITAIKRAIEQLSNDRENAIGVDSRSSLDDLPRLIITYTSIRNLTQSDMDIIYDLDRYLRGEV